MFQDRADAARQLARKIHGRQFVRPLVLAIPRGGLVTGAVLARDLDAELDVVLARKLRAPLQRELAIGAVAEDGGQFLNRGARDLPGVSDEYIARESSYQLDEILRRKQVFRSVRPPAEVAGRSVIVTDDGIATGATVIAALQTVRTRRPHELIVATPVGSPDRIEEVSRWCDEVICLLTPADFWAIGQFYADFSQVSDDEAVAILESCYTDGALGAASPPART
jgi:predicted phosphoribosyltransferase